MDLVNLREGGPGGTRAPTLAAEGLGYGPSGGNPNVASERLGVPDERGALRHRSHPASEEGGELVGWARSGWSLLGGPEQGPAVRSAVGIGDREPGLAEQSGG